MQKHDTPYRVSSALPMTVCVLLGLFFFGAYLIVRHHAPETAGATRVSVIFLLSYIGMCGVTCLFFLLKEHRQHGQQIMAESLNTKMHNMFKYVVGLPYAIVDDQGRVRALNSAMQDILQVSDPFYRGQLSDICGATLSDLVKASLDGKDARTEVGRLTLEAIAAAADSAGQQKPDAIASETPDGVIVRLHGDDRYVARAYPMNLNGRDNFLVTFTDASELLNLKEKMERDMPAVAYIDVDNLEELTQYTHVNYRDASRQVDDILISFTNEIGGMLREYERDRYILFFSQDQLRRCEEDRFNTLLDRVRNIRLGEYGIPVTISMGISLADSTMAERAKEASSALDLALQRGGDQVAVRRRDGIRYYGGQTRPFQRRTKVQSRVVANYLLTKISEADNLLIMGHHNPDFDSIGSCVGIAQLGLLAGVSTKIIIDEANENFKVAAARLLATETYQDMFISGHKGLDLIRSGTLLIITDVNNFRVFEAPEVADSVKQVSGKIVIIDHHRQTDEYDFDPVINYIDPSASSACELVTEMLEQSENGSELEGSKLVTDEVASVILSGIMLDTSGFTRNTGSRTLDAARYLYGKGANAEYVHSFFNIDYADYVCERSFSGCSLMQNDTVGLTWSHGTGRGGDDRIAAAKEADKLLNVKGVNAAFSLVATDDAVHISGRSDGAINVQLILERLGGGGRFDAAGAALSHVTLDEAIEDLRGAINAYFEELEDSHRGA